MAIKVKKKYTVGADVDLTRTIVRGRSGKRITNARAEKRLAHTPDRAPSCHGEPRRHVGAWRGCDR